MASLFENAVSSIRMGVEDFRQQDEDRDISAVRNLYAGILLLAKELLIRTVPDADPMHVISANLKPIPNGSGGIAFDKSTKKTVDFEDIIKRFKDFDLSIDKTALRELNGIRNDMEHHFSDQSANAIRSAISKVFPVAASLFRQMDEDPLRLLGDEWAAMLETKELYDQELKEARETLNKIKWYSTSMDGAKLKCLQCASELVEQIDPENESQNALELRCKTC